MIKKLNNILIEGSEGKPILIDATFKANNSKRTLLIDGGGVVELNVRDSTADEGKRDRICRRTAKRARSASPPAPPLQQQQPPGVVVSSGSASGDLPPSRLFGHEVQNQRKRLVNHAVLARAANSAALGYILDSKRARTRGSNSVPASDRMAAIRRRIAERQPP